MDFIPWTSFDRLVAKYGGDVRVRRFRCTEQFRAMAFAQLTYRESLRDIEACLGAQPSKLYGMGFRNPVAKSTLADANELRDWHMWHDLAAILICRARKLYADDVIGLDLDNTIYALDSTTIDLCLSLFPWADFRSTKAAVKMHTLLDLRGPIPSFIHVSNGKMGDALALDLITPEAGAIYIMDRGYVDFRRLHVFHAAHAFFVTRAKSNMKYHRVYSHPVNKAAGIMADQSVALDGFYTRQDYPEQLRRVRFCDLDANKRLVISDKQLCATRRNNRRPLQKALAGGIVLQMDQAEPPYQAFLRDIGECGEDPNLDRGERLRPGGDHQKGTGPRDFALHFSTDFVSPPLRETSDFKRVFRP